MKNIATVLITMGVIALMGCPTINRPVAATGNPVGSKIGQSTGKIILGFGDVDAGIKAAAEAGGITQISTVDFKTASMLGFVTTYTTTVTGE
ncbi:MAG: TRL-like family protein [Treponema sp.]|jgi:hypothetical protein|nr:TRL-like family protein [Treponema sp.]